MDDNQRLKAHGLLTGIVGLNCALLVSRYFVAWKWKVLELNLIPWPFILAFLLVFTISPILIISYGHQINFFSGRLPDDDDISERINSMTAVILSYALAIIIFFLWVVEIQKTIELILKH